MQSLAFFTALTSLGGYTMPPKSWMWAAQFPLFQLFALFILVIQSGHVSWFVAAMISIMIYSLIWLVKDLEDAYWVSDEHLYQTNPFVHNRFFHT